MLPNNHRHLKRTEVATSYRPQACNVIKKQTLAKVFSCDFCEISKNTLFTDHLWTTALGEGNFPRKTPPGTGP